MSSTIPSTEPKKKFGKNLNRLTKPPPPPVPSPAPTANPVNTRTSSSRNGLLLLSSTKARSSGGGGGLLAKKSTFSGAAPKPINTPSLKSESFDALLSWNSGSLRKEKEPIVQAGPKENAWGGGGSSAEKTPVVAAVVPPPIPILAPKGGVSAGYFNANPAPPSVISVEKEETEVKKNKVEEQGYRCRNQDDEYRPSNSHSRKDYERKNFGRSSTFPAENYHHYHHPANDFHRSSSVISEIPRDRSSYHSHNSRKERPDRPDPKSNGHHSPKIKVQPPSPDPLPSRSVPDPPPSRSVPDPPPLSRGVDLSAVTQQPPPSPSPVQKLKEKEKEKEPTSPQPNSSNPQRKQNEDKTEVVLELLNRPKPHTSSSSLPLGLNPPAKIEPSRSYGAVVGGTALPEDTILDESSSPPPFITTTSEPPPPVPVIQLSSYEDRGRGQLPSQPRMLFDPKSGSMIAAPNEKRYEKKHPKQHLKRKDSAPNLVKRNESQAMEQPVASSTFRKHQRKQPTNALTKKPNSPKVPPKKKSLPRTRGVLYQKPSYGKYTCADGCEADCGYGSHSVPGGRIFNPQGYFLYVESTKLYLAEKRKKESMDILEENLDGWDMMAKAPVWTPGESVMKSFQVGLMDEVGVMESDLMDSDLMESDLMDSDLMDSDLMESDLMESDLMDSGDLMESDLTESRLLAGFQREEEEMGGLGLDPEEVMHGMLDSPLLPHDTDKRDNLHLTTLSLEPSESLFGDRDRKNPFPLPLSSGNSPGRIFANSTWGNSDTGLGRVNWGGLLEPAATTTTVLAARPLPASFLSLSPGNNTWTAGFADLNTLNSTGTLPTKQNELTE